MDTSFRMFKNHRLSCLVLALSFWVGWACSGEAFWEGEAPRFRGLGTSAALAPWTQLSFGQTDVNTLNQRRIFFAHNSVGNNLVSALKRVAPNLVVRAGNSASLLNTPAVLEYFLNYDARPLEKIAAFETQVNNLGSRLDMAFMKLSYTDFEKFVGVSTDNMIAAYKATIDRLEARFPDVVFVHCTAPLYDWNASWDNNQRERFNAWLRTTYEGRVFDLATLEATHANGTPALSRDGVSLALAEEWASGGALLNTDGANRIAGALIGFLASDFSRDTFEPEPECRVGNDAVCGGNGYACVGIGGNTQSGAAGACQDMAECRVGNNSPCAAGYACVGTGGSTQNGAPGACQDVAECRVGNNNPCAAGYACVGTGGSTQNGAPGACQDVAECRVGNNSPCAAGYACVGTGGSTQNGAPGACQDVAECRVGNNSPCAAGYACVGTGGSTQNGAPGTCQLQPSAGEPWTRLGFAQADVNTLNLKRIFFAHSYVGNDIVSALKRVAPSLVVRTGNSASLLNNPGILEYLIGYDAVPLSKIAAFETQVNNLGSRLDMAFMKLSYTDFEKFVGVSADNIIATYKATLDRLEARFPNVVFLHCTTPLYNRNASWDNNQRERFNAWLRTTYKGRVFDLATLEATHDNGTRAFSIDGVSIALADEWATGASRLNTDGANRIAGSLIAFLASDFLGAPAEPECRVGNDAACGGNGYACVGISGNQNGAAGTCQDMAACRVGNNAACGGNGYVCVGISGNQNGAAGTCQDMAACRVGNNAACGGNGYVCVGISGNQNGAAGTCQDMAACRVGNDAACGGNGYVCVGISSNQNGAAGLCQDMAECRVGDNSCAAGYACVGMGGSTQNGAAGTCQQVVSGPECYVGNDAACGGNGYACVGIAGNQNGAAGTCQDVAACRVGNDAACGGNGYACVGIAGNQNGAAGTCQDVAACRVGNDAACGGNGYACVGIAGNQNGAAGTCQDVAACRVGDNSCAAGYACVGTSSNQNGAAGTCVQNPVNPGQPWTKVEFTQADVNVLRLRKVFFGHNSVGQNTIDGMRRVASTISVRTANSSNLNSIIGQLSSSPAFVEYMTENNGNPLAKITVFENAMGIVGDRVDIAFMKFCYADFPTNVNTLITTYQSAMTRLQQRFPHVLFIHVTAPLYNFNASYDNSNREQFNAWLRDTYKGKVFDLATIESVRPNGTTVLSRDGKTIALADEWTSDGGHLNTEGANRMGGALIAFLASLQL